MKKEIEVKIKISEDVIESLEKKLRESGFQPLCKSTFEENLLFDYPQGTLEESGCALRLRKFGDRSILTYKGPKKRDRHMKIREEIETTVGSFDTTRRLLESVGLKVSFEYAKWRRKYIGTWNQDDVEICIDRTPVGVFIEIEGKKESIHQVALHLGWNSSAFITENYVNLYREAQEYGS